MYREDIGYEVIGGDLTSQERRDHWEVAKGLQAVDALETSRYADEMAEGYISGSRTAGEFIDSIDRYYAEAQGSPDHEQADKVASRMVAALGDLGFTFAPTMLQTIHSYLFSGVLPDAIVGRFRDGNIRKREEVLCGRSVTYGDFRAIAQTLAYDFEQEVRSIYRWPLGAGEIRTLARFISSIWQVHPFFEGNTRTTALFIQLHLRQMGIMVNNDAFKHHSDFFRDALVRSNYASIPEGINADFTYLEAFLSNLLGVSSTDLDSFDLVCHQLGDDRPMTSNDAEKQSNRPS